MPPGRAAVRVLSVAEKFNNLKTVTGEPEAHMSHPLYDMFMKYNYDVESTANAWFDRNVVEVEMTDFNLAPVFTQAAKGSSSGSGAPSAAKRARPAPAPTPTPASNSIPEEVVPEQCHKGNTAFSATPHERAAIGESMPVVDATMQQLVALMRESLLSDLPGKVSWDFVRSVCRVNLDEIPSVRYACDGDRAVQLCTPP